MKRNEFLQMVGKLSIGTPLMVNGLYAKANALANAMNYLPSTAINCGDVNDRVLVIVRLAGANDGLNTLVPLSQYDTYANLRPTLKLSQTGINKVITLDSTLPSTKSMGLHPTLTGFKSLYDSGKMAVINGVAYPTSSYSHFASENIMFAGKDGTANSLNDGMMGRYLGSVYPGLAGRPNSTMQDPLALHFGSSNPVLMFNNTTQPSIEYNMYGLQNTLFSQLRTLPNNSESAALIDYISQIEVSSNSYHDRILNLFYAGRNSTTVYPNPTGSDFARQLKTVARLINGGSKTKIFQVTMGGFDTHVNQIGDGMDTSSHIGYHARLLTDLSNSIVAFLDDLQNLGLGDRVMTVSFSEFGRQVKENGNSGTDHGDLSPFFVFGNQVKGGVLGDCPTLPSLTSTNPNYYDASQRKYDYRQIYTTLLQDWLGASNNVLQNTGFSSFATPAMKLDLVKTDQNASPSCLSDQINLCTNPNETFTATKVTQVGNWSYYARGGVSTNPILFGIEHIPGGAGSNSNVFSVSISFSKIICNSLFAPLIHSVSDRSEKEGIFVGANYWNITGITGVPNGTVNLRFFNEAIYESDLQTAATNFKTASGSLYDSPLLYCKTANSSLVLPNDIRSDAMGFNKAIAPLKVVSSGVYNNRSYVQFNSVSNILGTGGCFYKQVTKTTQQSSKAKLRFNNVTRKFEGFDGANWVPLH